MNIKEIRRRNLRLLSRAAGGVSELAEQLGRSQSQISHLIGSSSTKNVGDRLAAHIERVFHKPAGWLDQIHTMHEEEETYLSRPSKNAVYRIPILTWLEAQEHFINSEKTLRIRNDQYILTSMEVSPEAIVLPVEGYSMETSPGLSFPQGALVFFDPDYPASNHSFVLAKPIGSSQLIFKQLVFDGNRRYLKPLNTRYPLLEISPHAIICAVARFMIFSLK